MTGPVRFPSRLLAALLIALVLGLAAAVQAQAPQASEVAAPARLTVLVFEGGRPVSGLTVRLGEAAGRTDADGAWRARLQAVEDRLTVFDGGQALLALPLQLRPGEVAQVLVTLTGESRRARVSIESSHEAADAPLVAAVPETEPEDGTGVLTGRVVSTETGEPVAGARLFVSGTPVEARTGADGTFRVEVPVGEYAVSVLHGQFATRTVDGVQVRADSATERSFELPPAGLELAEYVVVQPYIEGSLTSVIAEQRDAAGVANVLGAEQMSRAGDSDAGSALARVTGLTLVDGQFIYIRGLGERYSSTLLNGANVPSPDPTRKVVPLNLFPTGVIRSILVQKGYSPDMPGDFGGGAVEIRTRGIPEEDFLSIGISAGYREGTTFEQGLTYDGGSRDWTGFDDGTRSLPREIAEVTGDDTRLPPVANSFNPDGLSPEELEALGESFPNIYDIDRRRIGPDRGLSIEGGKLFEPGENWTAGISASVLWDDSWATRTEIRNTFIPLGDGSLRSNDRYTIERTTREINLSGFLTAGIAFRDDHRLKLTSMILRQTEDETSSQFGYNLDEDGDIRINQLEWEERQLISNQLEGFHRFGMLGDLELKWDYSSGRASLDVPDLRRYRYDPDPVAGLIFSRRGDSNVRRFSELADRSEDFGMDAAKPWTIGSLVTGTLAVGYRQVEKSRNSSIRRFQFGNTSRLSPDERRNDSLEEILTPGNIGPGGVELIEATRSTDNYAASLDITAGYANLDFTVAERVRIVAGARIEDWTQNVTTFQLFDPENQPIVSELGNEDLFPAASVTWYITGRQQLRGSYAETIIRPDFKEVSPAPFTDPVLDREVIGNAELVPSAVRHFDLRYEFYPGESELLSVGLFYKQIDDPIELTVEAGVEQRLTYANAEQAENFGIELEGRLQLGFLDRFAGRWLDTGGLMERFFVAGNLAWIDSEITIAPEDQGILTSTSRELQGQSPLIANVQLGYDDEDRGISANLLYNHVGERITEVGVLGAPDKFEQATHQLDFNFSWSWSERWSVSLKLKNLLDERFQITQGSETTQAYKKGREVGLGIDLDF